MAIAQKGEYKGPCMRARTVPPPTPPTNPPNAQAAANAQEGAQSEGQGDPRPPYYAIFRYETKSLCKIFINQS